MESSKPISPSMSIVFHSFSDTLIYLGPSSNQQPFTDFVDMQPPGLESNWRIVAVGWMRYIQQLVASPEIPAPKTATFAISLYYYFIMSISFLQLGSSFGTSMSSSYLLNYLFFLHIQKSQQSKKQKPACQSKSIYKHLSFFDAELIPHLSSIF